MLNELRAYLKGELERVTGLPVYFLNADGEDMPYVVFDIRDVPINDLVVRKMSLSVDLWDRGDPKTISEKSDEITKLWKHAKDNTDDFSVHIYTDTGAQYVDDPDQDVFRINNSFEVDAIFKEDN